MTVVVVGAGAFGTALAVALSRGGATVVLVGRDPSVVRTRTSARLPGIVLPDELAVSIDPNPISDANIVLVAVPTQALGQCLSGLPDLTGKSVVACCKGIDLATLKGPTSTIAAFAPGAVPAILTGPSFAADIARGLPTALTLACRDPSAGAQLQTALSVSALRIYRSTDTTGAELGGALKNVIAIACGACIGAGLGHSARAALLTRGFAEMRRLASAVGARPETLAGLSGLGDLVLTCTSDQSRNFSFGLALGAGRMPPVGQTVEGVATSQAAAQLGARLGVDLPISRAVADLVEGRVSVTEVLDLLLKRPLREE